jgi:DNA-binding protein H-NS
MAVQLDNLSIEELEQVISDARRLIEEKREEAVARARADIERIAASTGYSLEDLLGMGKSRSRTPARSQKAVAEKYRNPRDPSQSWSGRGKRPRWLQDLLHQGATLESLQVR